ncbi:biopolymer transporter ExbB [Rhodovulum sp. YNF3179]|uniref:biopolymer transporter ExbB n=1 Tax=Rhodovulum sp. YNF3179 TaxID=3425127 RepID=UPI003D352EA8
MAFAADREADAHFTQPVRQIVMMLVVIGLVAAGSYLVYPSLAPVFLSNPYLNGVIAGVFVIGVLACFWQVLQLTSSVSWIESFALDRPGTEFIRAPRLLAPLAALLRSRGARMQVSASSARSILDSVATRMDEARDITRYIINLLIFLGLLGTFYGLATTVPAVVETIRSLNLQEGESGVEVFGRLMTGLEKQLGGMGTAFASSLLGLAGSLVVGLLELFAGHGQNRFYRELEEWVSSITRLGFSAGDGDGGGVDQAAVASVLDHMVEQMDSLQNLYVQSDISRAHIDEKISHLTEAVERMTQRLEGVGGGGADPGLSAALTRVAEGQERLIEKLEERPVDDHADPESRMRLRSIDVQLLRILEEMSAGREESLAELRGDLAALTKALRQISRDNAERAGLAAGRRRS